MPPPPGGIAQLVEHLPCKQGVIGSNPITSTTGRTLPWAYPKIVSALVAIVQGAISTKDTLIEYREDRRTPYVRGGIS